MARRLGGQQAVGLDVFGDEEVDDPARAKVEDGAVDNHQDSDVYAAIDECPQPGSHVTPGRFAVRVEAGPIVNGLRTVDGDADLEVVSGEEVRPLAVHACRVGLDGVADDLSGAAEAGLQQHGPFEELHAEQCRLAPVPDELNDPVFLVAQDPCDRVRQNLE